MRLRIGVIATALLVTAGAANAQYIKDITVVAGGSNGTACPSGYNKNGQDLNQGAGGAFVYLCTMPTSNKDEALQGVDLVNWGNLSGHQSYSQGGNTIGINDACGGWGQLVDVDLNKGAGGAYLYFCKIVVPAGSRQTCNAMYYCAWLQDIKFNTSSVWLASDGQKCPWGGYVPIAATAKSFESAYDLNYTAGGKFIYGCQKLEKGWSPN